MSEMDAVWLPHTQCQRNAIYNSYCRMTSDLGVGGVLLKPRLLQAAVPRVHCVIVCVVSMTRPGGGDDCSSHRDQEWPALVSTRCPQAQCSFWAFVQ